MRMTQAAVQKEAFPLAGLLTIASLQNLKKPEASGGGLLVIVSPGNLIKPNTARVSLFSIVMVQGLPKLCMNLTKPDIRNLSKPDIKPAVLLSKVDIETAVIATNIDISAQHEDKFVPINEGQSFEFCEYIKKSFATSTRGEFLESIKKGSTCGAAPCAGMAVGQSSAASDFGARRWRCLTSRSRAATTNCPVVSPGSLNFSTAFAISCGTRAAIVCDFAFVDFVAITGSQCVRCSTVWQKKKSCKRLTCSTPVTNMVFNTLSTGVAQITKPGSASTLSGPLTTTVNASNEVAMSDHTTPISGRDSLTPKKYHYRFLALSRADAAARPCRISIQATTEQEARRALAPLFILSLAARLPVQEGVHA